MNILFLLRIVSSRSGVDIVTRILANEFVNLGYNVNLCCLDFSDNLVNSKIKYFKIFGDWRKIDTLQNISVLKNAIQKENINIIINQECQNIPWANLARKAIENSNAKIISCLHFPVLMSINNFGKKTKFLPKFFARFIKKRKDLKAINFACDNSDSLVLLSEKFLEHYKALQPKKSLNKLRVIANPINFNSECANLEKKQKTILFVGRISEFQKRLSLIIDVWKIILNTEKYGDWNLKIVGDGEDLENIKKKAEGLDRIYFEGKRESEPYFEEASIFFMTSAFEGFPMTLVESLQKACVPIAMDSFLSLRDIIENNENGIITQNNDINAFAENAVQLMDNEFLRRRMAENGMKSVERFSVNKISAEWEKLFNELTANSNSEKKNVEIPFRLRMRWLVEGYFYSMPFKNIKYFIWRIKRMRFIYKSSHFNFLRYFKSAFHKNLFISKKPKDFPNYLSVVAIMKNEALYVEEWLEYYLMHGVQKFYIYDNESSDNLTQILQPYIEEGIVEYKYFPYTGKQILAYNDVLEKAKKETYWLATIDIDEFIVPIENETITDFLRNYEQYAGVEINWLTYGSSGEKHWREGLVIERFKKHAKLDAYEGRTIKTICNPRTVFKMDIHTPFYYHFAKAVNPNKEIRKVFYMDVEQAYSKIRMNHYNTKSYGECLAKIQKGRVDGNGEYHLSYFEARDKNDEYDDIMDKYIPLVLENIKKRHRKFTELAEK